MSFFLDVDNEFGLQLRSLSEEQYVTFYNLFNKNREFLSEWNEDK